MLTGVRTCGQLNTLKCACHRATRRKRFSLVAMRSSFTAASQRQRSPWTSRKPAPGQSCRTGSPKRCLDPCGRATVAVPGESCPNANPCAVFDRKRRPRHPWAAARVSWGQSARPGNVMMERAVFHCTVPAPSRQMDPDKKV